ncbi:glycoside hydrolase N-terminal domain-containing protein [Caulobacter segnis]
MRPPRPLAWITPLAGPPRPESGSHVLWYQQPAGQWVEALPIGNGRLGAMIFGDVWAERLRAQRSHPVDRRTV